MITDVAQCILRGIKSSGQCYRVGGDEFIVLLTDSNEDADKIKNDIKAETEACDRKDYTVSVAIGYARGNEDKIKSVEDIEKLADKRMYKDKEEYYISKGYYERRYLINES